MAVVLPIYHQTIAVGVEAGNAAESVATPLTFASGSALNHGEYLSAVATQTGGALDTITFRVYRDAALTDKIHDFDVTFTALDKGEPSSLVLPIDYHAGLWFSAEAAGGAGRTVSLKPTCRAIAGKRP